ncbi:MAG TPA: ATP-binding protein [Segetibacter sp.]|jgi:light-regulated signal transduction histidine kinase (bacteriophytochrome)
MKNKDGAINEMTDEITSTSGKLMDVILANLLDAVLIVNLNGTIIYANKTTESLFSKPVSHLINQDFGFPVLPYEVQEIQVLQQSNILTVQMLASIIEWHNEKAFLLSLRDITKQKQVEAELEDEHKRLEAASFENQQYASLASHDLKEPIRKIEIHSELLGRKTKGQLDDAAQVHLEKIISSAKRMKALITGIAEFSKLSGNEVLYEETNLENIVKEVCTDLELRIQEKSAIIEVDHLAVIQANPVQMHQLFLNLVSNSIKYCSNDIAPNIKIKLQKDEEDFIEIVVSDNGIGFDNAFAEKVFQPFARLHAAQYDGSGIGLAICKKIIVAHGGTIHVTSIPNQGSQFVFSLLKKQHHHYNFPENNHSV